MRYDGLAIFVMFFGLAVLDAITIGNWVHAGLWVAVGVAFAMFDRMSARRRATRR